MSGQIHSGVEEVKNVEPGTPPFTNTLMQTPKHSVST